MECVAVVTYKYALHDISRETIGDQVKLAPTQWNGGADGEKQFVAQYHNRGEADALLHALGSINFNAMEEFYDRRRRCSPGRFGLWGWRR